MSECQEHVHKADRRVIRTAIGTVWLSSMAVYALTSFHTITWWDSLNYTMAAYCLGVPGPPGSLFTVIIGWIATRFVSPGSEAFLLNLVAAGIGAATCAVIGLAAFRLWSGPVQSNPTSAASAYFAAGAGATIGSLTLAFGDTAWLHSTKFTPYIFTACLTAVLLWQLVRLTHDNDFSKAWRRCVLIALLVGLDFSIHRTNLLAVPAVALWVLLWQGRLLRDVKVWVTCFCSLLVGLSFHFLILFMASQQPFLNFGDPSTLSRFENYVSLKQYGGGWLINIFPRKAPFWSYQILDYLKVFAANFFNINGTLPGVGALPALFGVFGIAALWKRNWKLGVGLVALFLCSSLGAILYFNIPSNFFRPFDRHYLPSFVIFALWIAYGLMTLFEWVRRRTPGKWWPVVAVAAVCLVAMPAEQVLRNYRARDGSHNYFAYDFGRNMYATLPPGALLFTFGDTDTYTAWYLSLVERQRPDVITMNVSLLNTPWYVRQLRQRYPDLPLSLTDEQISLLTVRQWPDTTVAVPIDGSADTARLHVPPAVEGQYLLAADQVILYMVKENRFRRPIYFSIGGSGMSSPWMAEHLRFEGLAQRFMPEVNPPMNLEIAARNLFEKYSYRGYADSTIAIDEATMSITPLYWQMFYYYLQPLKSEKSAEEHATARMHILALFPPARFPYLPRQVKMIVESISKD